MRKQGDQKHLTFEQRVDIEKGLTENKSFAEIAKLIGKDPSTVSKEVRRHSHEKERPDAGYTNPPCTNRKGCKMICLCEEQCGTLCKVCNRPSKRCIDFCPQYETPTCENFGNRLMCAMDVEKRDIVLCRGNFIPQSMLTMNIAVFLWNAELVSIKHLKAFRQ